MSSVGIFPAPGYTEGYVELAKSPTGRVFTKHILTIGRPFVHPTTGKPLVVDEAWFSRMKKNFDDGVSIVQVPVVGDDNKHTEDPLRNAGECIGLERDGDKVLAVLDVRDPDVADKLGKTLLGASAMMHMDYKDSASGERRGPALLHCAITNRPHLVDLDDYSEVVAASAEAYDELPDGSIWPPQVLMLAASEVDPPVVMLAPAPEPDYQPDQHDYSGGTMDEDRLRDDFGRLSLMAMQESTPRGRGWRPQYGMVVTDHDRQVAMSAQITDEDLIEATRELADQHQVSFTAVSCMAHDCHIRSGLGHSVAERAAVVREVALSLGRGDLEVSDDQVLALAASGGTGWHADTEVLRLTAEPELEDMFGLARHPSKSGKMVTTKNRAHCDPDDDADNDEDQPAKGGDVHKKLRAIIERNPDLLTDGEGRTVPEVNHKSYAPKSAARREREQRRAEGGHGRGARSIEDLAAGSARTRYGR